MIDTSKVREAIMEICKEHSFEADESFQAMRNARDTGVYGGMAIPYFELSVGSKRTGKTTQRKRELR